MVDMSGERCPFCGQGGELGVWDEELQAYAHQECSLSATWPEIEATKRRRGDR